MAFLDPAVALTTCETALRELMAHTYAERFGTDWLSRVAPDDKLKLWAGRAEDEVHARASKGVVAVPSAGLAYANLYDLVTIASKYWEPLSAALGEKAKSLPLIRRLDSLRNTVGHSRPLVPFEQDLMSGIAGQIRNQVTIFMSAQDEVGDTYPRIESVTDGFGRRIESTAVTGEVAGSVTTHDVIVRPGDRVQFVCVGTDPQGRDLCWTLGLTRAGPPSAVSPSGMPAVLDWDVDDGDVTETKMVEVYLSAAETRYHRFGSFDHRSYFAFRVRPPV